MTAGSIFRQINWVDIFVLVLLVRAGYVGLRRGFLNEVFRIFGIIIALFVSIRYYPDAAQFLTTRAFFSKLSLFLNQGFSFAFLFLAVMLIFKLGRFITQFGLSFEIRGPLEKIGGVICGFVRGGIIAGLVLFALDLLPFDYLKKSINQDSLSGAYLVKAGPAIYDTIIKFSPGKKNE